MINLLKHNKFIQVSLLLIIAIYLLYLSGLTPVTSSQRHWMKEVSISGIPSQFLFYEIIKGDLYFSRNDYLKMKNFEQKNIESIRSIAGY